MSERSAGDLLFERYLTSVGIAVPEHEQDLGVPQRPDYPVVLSTGETCICEVKEFAPGTDSLAPERSDGMGGWSMSARVKPIRSKLHDAAPQLKAVRHLGHSLVAVLANPHRAPVILEDREVISAMRGDLIIEMPATGPAIPSMTVGRNGKRTNSHPYISAVAILHPGWTDAEDPWVTAFVTNSPGAVAIPETLFRGPRDHVIELASLAAA
jgi:hypothetical protein